MSINIRVRNKSLNAWLRSKNMDACLRAKTLMREWETCTRLRGLGTWAWMDDWRTWVWRQGDDNDANECMTEGHSHRYRNDEDAYECINEKHEWRHEWWRYIYECMTEGLAHGDMSMNTYVWQKDMRVNAWWRRRGVLLHDWGTGGISYILTTKAAFVSFPVCAKSHLFSYYENQLRKEGCRLFWHPCVND
jgi:hypothetical protein